MIAGFPVFDRLGWGDPKSVFGGIKFNDVIGFANYFVGGKKLNNNFPIPSIESKPINGWLVQEVGESSSGGANLMDGSSWSASVSNGTVQSVSLIPVHINAFLFPFVVRVQHDKFGDELVFTPSYLFDKSLSSQFTSRPFLGYHELIKRAMLNIELPLSHSLLYETFLGESGKGQLFPSIVSLKDVENAGLGEDVGLPFDVLREMFVTLGGGPGCLVNKDSAFVVRLAERLSGVGLG